MQAPCAYCLDGINGIGPKTVEQLFSTFKSLDGIKKATREELISLIGEKKADILLSHFSK